mgnify:CR=1 FL=1
MNKRGNYFIAMYDLEDNYICSFDSIQECALFFNVTSKYISNYLNYGHKLFNQFKLFKINDTPKNINYNQERTK